MSDEPLFTAEERARLDRLRLLRRQTMVGERMGDWRSWRTGAGGLFADHRDYVPGDDLRYVDWNVYGRLGDLVVKRFEAEENLNLLLCVDRSASMRGAKSRRARRIAGALGHIALAHQEHVRLAWLPASARGPMSVHRGRGRSAQLLGELAREGATGDTDHTRDIRPVLHALRGRGIAVVLSDFYDPKSAVAGLARLNSRGLDVAAIHILDGADVDLPVGASIRAVDQETGETLDVDVTPELVEALHAAWRRRAYQLERWCVAREVLYQRVDVSTSLWDVLHNLLARGLVAGGGR